MKQFLHSYVFSLFSDSAAFFLFKLLSENRRRFVLCLGHFRYFMGVSCKVEYLRGESWPILPSRNQPALFRLREGR